MSVILDPAEAQRYREDGVICLRGVLDRATLDALEACYEWSLAHPTPSASRFDIAAGTTFYQDLCNPAAAAAYREVLCESPVADVIAQLWGSDEVWFLYEQVFVKEGGDVRRTPWHQDAPYLALDGEQIAVMWINFLPVPATSSLEFVRGSHRGTLYDGSAFDPNDDTVPVFGHGLPRLPDIEAQRQDWDIVSWGVEPGDIVIFHPAMLHGGAPTAVGERRRTLSLRFFGADAVYAERPEPAPAPLVDGLHDTLSAGQPFRHRAFPQLRPAPQGFETVPGAFSGEAMTIRTRATTAN